MVGLAVIGSAIGATGLLTAAYASGWWPTKQSVAPACPNHLNSDWARVDNIVRHLSNWTHIHWEGEVQCFNIDGSMTGHVMINVPLPLDGCPAEASIAKLFETREFVDFQCDPNKALSGKLASFKIAKRFDGTPLLFARDSILDATLIGKEGGSSPISVSARFAYKHGQRWAPMVKDLWALMNEKNEDDMVIFKKVESLFQNIQYRSNTVESLVQEKIRQFPEARAYLQLNSGPHAPALVTVSRHGSFAGASGPHQFLRGSWGQMYIEQYGGVRRLYRGSKFVGVVAECYSANGGWDTSQPKLPLPMTQWILDPHGPETIEARKVIDNYCLSRAAGRPVLTDDRNNAFIFAESDIIVSIKVTSPNRPIVVSGARRINAGPDDWSQTPEGRWVPRNTDAWVALTGKGPNGGMLFHKVGSRTGWGEAFWNKVWRKAGTSIVNIYNPPPHRTQLEARRLWHNLIEVTLAK